MGELIDSPMHRALMREDRQMNTHTLHLEPGALDNIPLIKLAALLAQYGSEIAAVDGRLVIRKVAEGDGPETAA